jgi:tetratricopeptide (TPR) repeat protein
MPSIVSGFEYDIFISYRHKDNKGEHWVSEFVNALKIELEATFKEDISIYFDENPHDGLLETHDVDDSLQEKLRCLIFIPIISQTYCDTRSFAWRNEFLVFKKLASDDHLGLKVKLANGNVTSRILPIKIHDLDAEDKALLETEIGGALRAIDFIFKSPGVNRPLRSREDHPQDNQNKTFYRDQVNKVANSVKDLIHSVRSSPSNKASIVQAKDKVRGTEDSKHRKVTLIAALIILVLGMGSLYYFLKSSGDVEVVEASTRTRIAILPFKVIGENAGEYFAAGMKEMLVKHLRANEKLSVPPSLVATDRFLTTTLTHLEIAKELNTDFLVAASTQKWGDSIRLVVELIDPWKDEVRWTRDFKTMYSNIFEIQETMAVGISDALEATLSGSTKEKINRVPTQNVEAYDLFLQGIEYSTLYVEKGFDQQFKRKARQCFLKSIQLDPQFAEPYIALAGTYFQINLDKGTELDSLEILINKGLEIYPSSSEGLNLKAQFLFFHKQDTVSAFRIAEEGLAQDPYNRRLMMWIGWLYHYWLKDGREIKGLQYYLQAYYSDPAHEETWNTLANIGSFFCHIGDFSRSEYFLQQAISLHPNDLFLLNQLGYLYIRSGQYQKLSDFALTLENMSKEHFPNNYSYLSWKATAYLYAGKYSEGLVICDEYLTHKEVDAIFSVYTMLLTKNGFRKKAEKLWRESIEVSLKEASPDYSIIARCFAMLGDREKALSYFEKIEFSHTNSQLNPDFYSRDLMLESIWNEPRFIKRIQEEKDRLKGIRERLAKMEKERIITLPQLIKE